MNVNGTFLLFLLLIFSFSLSQVFAEFLLVKETLLYDHFNNQLPAKRVEQLLDVRKGWLWVNYILTPLVYSLKVALTTLWILSGIVFFGYQSSFKEIVRIVIIAEFVWLIPSFITLIWFGLIDVDYSLREVQYFKPLSLLNLFEVSEVDGWLIFPLQSLNLFEIAYMFALAIGIKRAFNKGFMHALNFTASVYGAALVTWIVFITFLSINLTA